MDPSSQSLALSEEHRTTRAYRSRISAGSIAQLVSKFESLDIDRCPYQHRHSDTNFARGDSCINLGRRLYEHNGTNTSSTNHFTSENFEKSQGNGFSNLSHVCWSSDEFPAHPSLKLRRSRSLKTKPSGSFGLLALGQRHKSVAERRRIFETGNVPDLFVVINVNTYRSRDTTQPHLKNTVPVQVCQRLKPALGPF
jgi:hypothetical protein